MNQNSAAYQENKLFQKKLREKSSQIGIALSDTQLGQFDRYYQMMVETNKHMNLTAITEEDEVISKHFVDSLSCAKVMDMEKVHSIIDIGTGAGFPGIPLKIAYPEIEIVLVDSLQKRIKFLNEVIQELGLEKVTAVHGRAEDLARDKRYRGVFDLCVSRAVANLSTLTEYCIPFVRVNGYFVSYKAQKGLEELEGAKNCLQVLGCKVEDAHSFVLEGDDSQRVLLKIKKCKGTGKTYPRKAGVPSKNPL